MKANLKIVAGVGAAMLFAGSANAAVLTATAKNFSKEGISSTGFVSLPVVDAVLAADYSADDRIAFTISGATINAATTSLTADMVCNNDIVVGLLNISGNTINFRVNQVGIQAENRGAECTISGIDVTKASIVGSSTVTGTYAAKTSLGEPIDLGCADPGFPGDLRSCATGETPNVVTLANIRSQFSAGVTTGEVPFNGVIDVEADRELFVFPDEFTGNLDDDTLYITVKNEGTLEESVDGVSGELTISGDFSWAAGKDGKCGTTDDLGAVVSQEAPGGEDIAEDCASFTVDYGSLLDGVDTVVSDQITVIALVAGSGVKLSPQSFAADYVFAWPTNRSSSIKFAAGAWTINGALVFVPYMPYGDNITQIVYIANRGGQDAAITVDAFDEAGDSYTFTVGVVEAGTVRKLAQELLDGLTLGGFVPPGKVAFEITVNAPDQDIDVYSAYNVGGSDRGTVVNSQNGKALQ